MRYETCPQILAIEEVRDLIGRIGRNRIIDLVPATIYGLLDDLVPGSELSNKFSSEFERFSLIQTESDSEENLSYGNWVYFPRDDKLVRFAEKYWHRIALLVRNSTLIADPEMKMSWFQIRERFDNAVIAVAGCSLGNNVAHAVARDLRPLKMKVADHKDYQLTNANRVHLTYDDLNRNKAIVTAEQLNSLDPFMDVSVFSEGVHEGNIDLFVNGDGGSESSATVILEETDDPDMKIFIRENARKSGIPVVMVSDVGSAAQVDIRRFDLDRSASLAPLVSDADLYQKRDEWRRDLANRKKFYEFAFSLIGNHYNLSPEFRQIVLKENLPMFGGVPQLGSTAMMAGGIAGEVTARLLLGFKLPERMFMIKYNGQVVIEGETL